MAASAPHPRPLIVDTDVGADDAVAILLALRRQSSVGVVAMTSCFGNVSCDQATINASALLKFSGLDRTISVYRGCEHPLIGRFDPTKCWEGHGKDGLGDSGLSALGEAGRVEGDHAAIAIRDITNARPREVELLMLGPLTNLALALKLDPTLPSRVKGVTVMGGCESARGNASRAAEFNFHADPEAAHIVFEAFTPQAGEAPRVTIVPWELCVAQGVPWTFFDSMCPPENDTPKGKFFKDVNRGMEKMLRVKRYDATPEINLGRDINLGDDNNLGQEINFCPCDAYAAAVHERPGMVKKARDLHVEIELNGVHSRGMTAFDWYGRSKKPANVRLIQDIDNDAFREMLQETFLA